MAFLNPLERNKQTFDESNENTMGSLARNTAISYLKILQGKYPGYFKMNDEDFVKEMTMLIDEIKKSDPELGIIENLLEKLRDYKPKDGEEKIESLIKQVKEKKSFLEKIYEVFTPLIKAINKRNDSKDLAYDNEFLPPKVLRLILARTLELAETTEENPALISHSIIELEKKVNDFVSIDSEIKKREEDKYTVLRGYIRCFYGEVESLFQPKNYSTENNKNYENYEIKKCPRGISNRLMDFLSTIDPEFELVTEPHSYIYEKAQGILKEQLPKYLESLKEEERKALFVSWNWGNDLDYDAEKHAPFIKMLESCFSEKLSESNFGVGRDLIKDKGITDALKDFRTLDNLITLSVPNNVKLDALGYILGLDETGKELLRKFSKDFEEGGRNPYYNRLIYLCDLSEQLHRNYSGSLFKHQHFKMLKGYIIEELNSLTEAKVNKNKDDKASKIPPIAPDFETWCRVKPMELYNIFALILISEYEKSSEQDRLERQLNGLLHQIFSARAPLKKYLNNILSDLLIQGDRSIELAAPDIIYIFLYGLLFPKDQWFKEEKRLDFESLLTIALRFLEKENATDRELEVIKLIPKNIVDHLSAKIKEEEPKLPSAPNQIGWVDVLRVRLDGDFLKQTIQLEKKFELPEKDKTIQKHLDLFRSNLTPDILKNLLSILQTFPEGYKAPLLSLALIKRLLEGEIPVESIKRYFENSPAEEKIKDASKVCNRLLKAQENTGFLDMLSYRTDFSLDLWLREESVDVVTALSEFVGGCREAEMDASVIGKILSLKQFPLKDKGAIKVLSEFVGGCKEAEMDASDIYEILSLKQFPLRDPEAIGKISVQALSEFVGACKEAKMDGWYIVAILSHEAFPLRDPEAIGNISVQALSEFVKVCKEAKMGDWITRDILSLEAFPLNDKGVIEALSGFVKACKEAKMDDWVIRDILSLEQFPLRDPEAMGNISVQALSGLVGACEEAKMSVWNIRKILGHEQFPLNDKGAIEVLSEFVKGCNEAKMDGGTICESLRLKLCSLNDKGAIEISSDFKEVRKEEESYSPGFFHNSKKPSSDSLSNQKNSQIGGLSLQN